MIRPKAHLPLMLVFLLVATTEWIREKLHLPGTCHSFLTPVTIHVFSCTRTFDSSKAQRFIGYSPVASLQVSMLLNFVNAAHKYV